MIIVGINNQNFRFPEGWGDITAIQAAKIHYLFREMPDKLMDFYKAIGKGDSDKATDIATTITNEENIKTFPEWYGKFLCAISDVPEEVMNKTHTYQRSQLFDRYEWIALGLMFAPTDFPVQYIKDFKHKGTKYDFPKTGIKPGGELPGAFMDAEEFTHSADLMAAATDLKDGDYSKMITIVAILCREPGNVYDTQDMYRRAKEFEDLPMTVVWEVYFFIIGYLATLSESMVFSLKEVMSSAKSLLNSQGYQSGAGMEAS